MRIAASLALLVLCGAAPAAADTMSAAFGNTVTVAHPNGATERYYFEPDGSVRMVMPDGAEMSAQWEQRGEEVCLTMNGQENCSPVPADKVAGDSWALETGGGTITVSIVEGR